MSSEQLADGVNPLDAELAATWDILKGYSGRNTDLGIARRFGGATAAYSLRDIGAMNGRVVKVRRDSDDTEEDFSAAQIASGALETFVQAGTTYGETNATAFSFSGERSGGTTSSNGIDGFTLDVETASAFAGYQLSSTVSSGTNVYVSFNASLSEGSGAASPQVKLRSSSISGSTASNTYDVIEGFNSFELTSNDNAAEYFSFSEGDDNKIFTISDVKVSLTSRNGFVKTWYDQSDSGNDATQATAGNQPSIVKNGGLCKSNGSPSVFFTGDTRDDELDFTDLTLTDATIFTVVNIDASADQQIIIGGSTSTSTGAMIPMMDNGSSTTQVYKNSTVGGAEQGSSQFKNGAQITLANRNDAFDNLAVNTQLLFTMVDVDVAEAKVLDGISRTPSDATTFHLQGQMNELIIYNSDLSSDRGTLESEIANFYNITLS